MNAQATSFADFQNTLQQIGKNATREDLSDAERVRRAKKVFLRQLDGRRAVDIDTCLQCGMCAEACHFYEATQDEKYAPVYKYRLARRFYRRELSPMRWIYKIFTPDIKVRDLEEWRYYLYDACTGCGRCDMICPMGINISTLIRISREAVGAAGLIPDDLQALQQEQKNGNSLFGVDAAKLRSRVSELAAEGVEIPLDRDKADFLLLTTATELLLFPDSLAANAKILNKSGVSWTVSSDAFDAMNLGYIAGDDEAMKVSLTRIVDKVAGLGAKAVVVPESGHGYQVLRWLAANRLGKPLTFDVLSMPEFITWEIGEGRLTLKQQGNGGSVTYHDPCRLGRKGGVMDEPRDILKKMGFDVRECEAKARENFCCGGGCGEFALSAASTLRQKAFEVKKHQFDDTGADKVVTGCTSCRYNLTVGGQKAGWDTPVTSLVETVAANLAD
jgi:Fe-S oxidoreductase